MAYTNFGYCPQIEQAIRPPCQHILSLCKFIRHVLFSILSPSSKAGGGQGHHLLLSLGVSSVMDRQVIHNAWVSVKHRRSNRELKVQLQIGENQGKKHPTWKGPQSDLNPVECHYNNAIQTHSWSKFQEGPNPQNPSIIFNIHPSIRWRQKKKKKTWSGDKKSTKLETVSDNVCVSAQIQIPIRQCWGSRAFLTSDPGISIEMPYCVTRNPKNRYL